MLSNHTPAFWRNRRLSCSTATKKLGHVLLWTMPTANAIADTATVIVAINAMDSAPGSQSTLHYKLKVSSIGLITLAQSLALNGQPTVTSFYETIALLRQRAIPGPELSRCKEVSALSLGLMITLCAASCDFAASYFFVQQSSEKVPVLLNLLTIEKWHAIAISVGSISAFTTIFTEGMDTYKSIRGTLLHNHYTYQSRIAQSICYLIGYPICILASAENMYEAYGAMKDIFNPRDTAIKLGMLAFSLPKSVSDFNFASVRTIYAIDKLIGRVTDLRPTLTEIITMILSIAAAIFVVAPQLSLTANMLKDPDTSLPFETGDVTSISLGYGVTLRDGLVQTYTLYPVFYQLTHHLHQLFAYLLMKLSCRENELMEAASPNIELQSNTVLKDFDNHYVALDHQESPRQAQNRYRFHQEHSAVLPPRARPQLTIQTPIPASP
jgi:hypothetical protein